MFKTISDKIALTQLNAGLKVFDAGDYILSAED